MLTLGSLFDGIGGWILSAKRNGITPVLASEIEPFPIAVTKHHFPDVLHLGSVTDIKGDEIEPVDIITSGSPCQDLSVAGKQVPVVQAFSNSCFGGWTASETGQTLTAKGGGIGGGSNSLVNAGAVRRLTPLECERLQGLPDNYTLIPHKSCSDSARYKAIGNGMAQPCSDYVLSVVKRMAG